MLITDGNPPSICRNDSPPSSLNQIEPSLIPTKNASASSESPAVARGAALKWSGNPPDSLRQVSPWSSLRKNAAAAPSGRRHNGGGTAAAAEKRILGRAGWQTSCAMQRQSRAWVASTHLAAPIV